MKLSEIKDDEMLLVNELADNKSCGIKNSEVYTTKQYQANLDAKTILEDSIENEYQNMFEDWDQDIWNDITEDDIKNIQIVLDRILERRRNTM